MAVEGVFHEAGAILPSLVPVDDPDAGLMGLGDLRVVPRSWGLKVWFGPARPPKEHYEAQVLGANADPTGTAKVLILEVGFHAESPKEEDNDATLERLLKASRTKAWRTLLGPEAVAGDSLGGSTKWRRVSEVWPDPDFSNPEAAFEIAARLTDYLLAIEPVRRQLTSPAKRPVTL